MCQWWSRKCNPDHVIPPSLFLQMNLGSLFWDKYFFCYVLTRHQIHLQEQKHGQEDLDSPCPFGVGRVGTVLVDEKLLWGTLFSGKCVEVKAWAVLFPAVRRRARGLAAECIAHSALGFCKLNGCPLLRKPYVGCLCHVNYGQAPFPRNALFKIAFLCWWCTHLELDLLCPLLPCSKCSPVGPVIEGPVGQ